MSHTDLHQLSKKNQEFIRIAKHQLLLENGNQRKTEKPLIQEIYQLSMKTKEKEFRHGISLSLNCLGEFFQRKNAMKKSIRN